MELDKISLFRLLHWQNVEHVLKHGLCCKEHPKSDPDYINIGHRQLISDRHEHPIPINGAGNLGEYVPFYFWGNSPMLFLIMNGSSGVKQRPQEDLVYLRTSFLKIQEHNLEYVYSDRNAKIAFANFFNNEKDFDKVHWEIVRKRVWKNDESNRARQDLKQAEFLVRNYVPVSCIQTIIVKTEEKKLYFEEIVTNSGLNIAIYLDIKHTLYY